MRTVISNFFTGDNGERAPDPEVMKFSGIHLNRNVALVVDKQEDKGLEKIWRESHPFYRQKVWALLLSIMVSHVLRTVPFPQKIGTLTSNANTQDAKKAIDGNQATCWSSNIPQRPGIFYQVDLKTVQVVKGFTLFLGESINDYPRSLKVLYSLDGSSWKEIKTLTEPVLYWTGGNYFNIKGRKKSLLFFSPTFKIPPITSGRTRPGLLVVYL